MGTNYHSLWAKEPIDLVGNAVTQIPNYEYCRLDMHGVEAKQFRQEPYMGGASQPSYLSNSNGGMR